MDLKAMLAEAWEAAQKYRPNDHTDYVRWTAFRENGTEISRWEYTSCYSPGMHVLPHLEIHCLPWQGSSSEGLPAPWYRYFFRLLKQVGLCPPEAKVAHRNGANCLILPRTGWDRHTIYIPLCYYRQADRKPHEVAQAILLWRQLASQGTHFLQVLHYLAVTTSLGSGHYFMSKGPYGNSVPTTSLANGQALAWFARLSKEQRLEICPLPLPYAKPTWDTDLDTYALLAKKAKEMESESVKVEELVEILDPKYARYYESPVLAGKQQEA